VRVTGWRCADRLEQALAIAEVQPEFDQLAVLEVRENVQIDAGLPQQGLELRQVLLTQPCGKVRRRRFASRAVRIGAG
jgi:CelD/BcsL family acetyltransferase involved in cellulose biosynthesis